jgi:hypothetical protein
MAQYAVPQADPAGTVSAGNWVDTFFGTDLADATRDGIIGGTPDDSTSIRNGSSGSTTCELLLQSLSTPSAGNHIIRIRANGFGDTVDVDVYDGASFVDGTTFTPGGSFATLSYTLTSTPSSYNNLRVKLITSSTSINVSEVELEVPDADSGGGGGDVEDPTNPEAFLMFL